MPILNSNGTPYKASGSLQIFDQQNPDIDFMNDILNEYYKLWGSPALLYDIFINIENVDSLYLEDRSKLWSNTPVEISVLYEPVPSNFASTTFGIDGIADVMLDVHRKSLIDTLGHKPMIGSKIFLPLKQEMYVLVAAVNSQFNWWQQWGISLVCQKFQETVTDASATSSPPVTNFNID